MNKSKVVVVMGNLVRVVILGFLVMVGAEGGVKLGIDVLKEEGFGILRGKRVGLLTHPAGVNGRGESTVDVLRKDKRVNLVALFGPEHGVYGKELAEVHVSDCLDKRTGLPAYSLYGKTMRPTAEMLKGVDVMVVDLQDVGVRCYTYISCMLNVMEVCCERGIEVVVLDRPNPLGGEKISGPILEARWMSYVGCYMMPLVHGMTIGELALMFKDQHVRMRKKGRVSVVKMRGWRREMMWPDTGLKWVRTSPAIPTWEAVVGYPMVGTGCQIGGFRHGYRRGSMPFRHLSFEGKGAEEVMRALKRRGVRGLDYKVVQSKGEDGKVYEGVGVYVRDVKKWRPAELNFHLMVLACEWNRENPFARVGRSEMELFNKHVGSTEWWEAISRKGAGVDVGKFMAKWDREGEAFRKWVMKNNYYLYR